MKSYKIFSIIFLFLSLAGSLYLVKLNQDNRNRASSVCSGTWSCSSGSQKSTYNCSIFNGMTEESCTGGGNAQGNFCASGWTRSGGCSYDTVQPLQCPSGQRYVIEPEPWGWHEIQCGQGCPSGQGKKVRCNLTQGICVTNDDYKNNCTDASNVKHWESSGCISDPACVAQEAQVDKNHESDVLTFNSSGKVHVYFKYLETLSSANPGWKIKLTPKNGGASVADLTGSTSEKEFSNVFSVTAGKQYQVQVIFDEDVKTRPSPYTSFGWIKPQGEQCVGKNGASVKSISASLNHIKSISTFNISDPQSNAVQCWADAIGSGNNLEDYDFNDFVLIFSYEKVISTSTPIPTNTPVPTNTPAPTNTPVPTNTPAPTNTPVPTSTPNLVCGSSCGDTAGDCPNDHTCVNNKCILTTCLDDGVLCNSSQCKVLTPTATRRPTNTPAPTDVIAEAPSPTRIVLPQSGVEFPSQALTIVGAIVTLLGFLILL